MKVTKLLQRTTGLLLALVMLISFPAGAFSEGTGSNLDKAPEIPEGFVWRTLSVEAAPFEEDCAETEKAEADRIAEKLDAADRFLELMLSHKAAIVEETEEEKNEATKQVTDDATETTDPTIEVRGWMPEDITAKAELIAYEQEDLYKELALAQVEIRFYDGNGQSWCPEYPLTVCLDGEMLEEAREAKMEPTAYIYEELPRDKKDPEKLSYTVDAFSATRKDDEEMTYECEQDKLHADVNEHALTKVQELPDAVCFETQSAATRFLLTARQPERSFTAASADGKVELAVVGTLPRDLSASVAGTSLKTEAKLPGEPVLAWELSLQHPEASAYQADGTVKIALRDKALAELKNDVWDLQLWQIQKNGEAVRVKDAVFKGENLRFSADELTTFVAVQVAVEKHLNATDGKTYSVQVSYDSRAGIPAGAELVVREILPNENGYISNMKQCAARVGQEASQIDFARMFDVTIRDPKTGETYQPTNDMRVKIDLISEDMSECTKINVVRLGQKAELMDTASVKGGAVTFAASEPSVFVVMGVTLEKTITSSDGKTYEISVSYDKDAGLPAGAELHVEQLTGADYMKYLAKTAEFLSREEEQLVNNRFFDITIVKDGVAYEPNDAVTVSIRLLNQPETRGVLRVVHFGEEKTELLENCMTEDGCLTFDTKSFSVYAITNEDGTIAVPRVFYYFYDGSVEVGHQIIKNEGVLSEPTHQDPANQAFLGWFIYDEATGTWGDQIKFEVPGAKEGDPNTTKAITVLYGGSGGVEANSVVVPEIKENGQWVNHIDVVVKTRYTSNFATIKFRNDDEGTNDANAKYVDTDTVAMLETEDSKEYVIPAASKWEKYFAGRDQYVFVGWSLSKPPIQNGKYNFYTDRDSNRMPETSITVKRKTSESKDVILYPVFKKAHWLYFKTGPAGSTAEFIRPVYVLNSNTTENSRPESDPEWRGYRFLYWTLEPTFDSTTGEMYDFGENPPAEYKFNQKLSEDTTLYAYWEAGYTTYTVITWQESLEDLWKPNWDSLADSRTYKVYSQESRDAKVGDFVDLTADDQSQSFKGFHHRDDSSGGLKDSVNVEVQPSGVTVLNVYYDRDVLQLQFYTGNRTNGPQNGYKDTIWTSDSASARRDVKTITGLYGQPLSQYKEKWPAENVWQYYMDPNNNSDLAGISYLGQFIYPDENPKYKVFRAFWVPSDTRRIYTFYRMDTDEKYYTDEEHDYLKDEGATDFDQNYSAGFTFTEKYDGFKVKHYQTYYYNLNNQRVNLAEGDVSAGSQVSLGSQRLTYYYNGYYYYKYVPVHLDVFYERQSYKISFYDSMDGLALKTQLQNGDYVSTENGILYEADLSKYYPNPEFKPASKEKGWNFNGRWYSDQDRTTQIFFGDLTEEDEKKLWYYNDPILKCKIYINDLPPEGDTTRDYHQDETEIYKTMPNRNLAVYAGFENTWYWIKIDPNGGSLNGNDPEKDTDLTYYWKQYGGEISEYSISRDFVKDTAGTYYYHYDEFDTSNPYGVQPLTRRAYYTQNIEDATDKTTTYRPAEEDEGYQLAGWYRVEIVDKKEKLTKFNFEESRVNGDTVLRAMWKQKGDYRVVYSLDKAVDVQGKTISGITPQFREGEVIVDDDMYALDSAIVIQPGVVDALTQDEETLYSFKGWYIGGVYAPGEFFIANQFLASRYPGAPETARSDTFILYPVFEKKGDIGDLSGRTSLVLDANGGERTENFKDEDLPRNAYFDGKTRVYYTDAKSSTSSDPGNGGMTVNMDAELPLPENNNGGLNVFSKENAEFLGWSFDPNAVLPKFKAGQLVGVDNNEIDGDQGNTLYAVWRLTKVNVQIELQDADTFKPIVGGSFTLVQSDGNAVEGAEGMLVSGADGLLAKDNTTVFALKTPLTTNVSNNFVLKESETAPGYIDLGGDVTIKVRYDGTVLYRCPGDTADRVAQKQSNGIPKILLQEHLAICKVVNDGVPEKLFAHLQSAVDYAESLTGSSRIEMLDNYEMHDDDFVTVNGKADIILTTASKNAKNPYRGEGTIATITRADSGTSMFTVKGGSFGLKDIILDGGSASSRACVSDGGIVCLQNASMKVDGGTTLRNSKVASNTDAQSGGGAIAAIGVNARLEFVATEENRVRIMNCVTTYNGGAISVTNGATVTLKNIEITGNAAVSGAGVYVSAGSKLRLSDGVDFGGPGVTEDGTVITSVGNFSTEKHEGATNARAAYPYARQDIYLAEAQDDPASLIIAGDLNCAEGSIWVYAENANHYQMLMPFAVVEPETISDESYKVFRNAREDSDTLCGGSYLTGQPMIDTAFVQWTGGNDVKFLKLDSNGDTLEGAEFSLFEDLECTQPVKLNENDANGITASSDGDGVVLFEKLNPNVYYMKETNAPDGMERSDDVYILLVGAEFVAVPSPRTGLWNDVLHDIQQTDIDEQTALYEEKFELNDYAIFLVEDEKAVTTPSIADKGIVNYFSGIRPVILSKINITFDPLTGAKFVLRSVNGRVLKQGDTAEFESNESGVFFAGPLHYGIYYLEETQTPSNPADPSATYHKPTHYFVIKVEASGVKVWRKSESDGYEFASTNTVTEPNDSNYLIPQNP